MDKNVLVRLWNLVWNAWDGQTRTLSEYPYRQRMETDCSLAARAQQVGTTRALLSASDRQCALLCGAQRLHLEDASARVSALASVSLLLCPLASQWGLGATQSRSGWQGARAQRKKKAPTAAIIDSQSVKMASQPGERGFDAGKKIMGRKRHILVDTLGLILGVVVHPANVQDRDGAKLLRPWLLFYGWLRTVFVDGGYAGQLAQWMAALPRHRRLRMEVVKRPAQAQGFHLLPKRWVVERTFAWLGNFRRLSKDYEVKPTHEEAIIYLASAALLSRRLAKSKAK